jgi:hypothetical protein
MQQGPLQPSLSATWTAFFGWLVSTAMTVLLVALVAVAASAGILPGTDPFARAAQESSGGMTGMIVLLSLQLLAYFLGGYVAGRMARFNGVGLAPGHRGSGRRSTEARIRTGIRPKGNPSSARSMRIRPVI